MVDVRDAHGTRAARRPHLGRLPESCEHDEHEHSQSPPTKARSRRLFEVIEVSMMLETVIFHDCP